MHSARSHYGGQITGPNIWSERQLVPTYPLVVRQMVLTYSSGQNKVPTAELKSRLIVVQKSFDSRSIVAQWKIVSAYAPL